MTPDDDRRLARLLDERDIRDVLARYCRGIDRRDLDLVRTCFHPDATDDHGPGFRGGVEDLLAYVAGELARYSSTTHLLGQILVEHHPDDPTQARAEAYVVAYHRKDPSGSAPGRDFVVGLRYVDDVERRDGAWRIARRVCAVDWSRMDAAGERGWPIPAGDLNGRAGGDDPVFRPWPLPGGG